MTEQNSSAAAPAIQVQILGKSEIQRFTGSFNIGRAPDNDVVVYHEKVSQQHAAVVLTDGQWYLHDRGSSNGTFVHGKRTDGSRLAGSVRVRLGHDGPTLVLTTEGAEPAARPTVLSEPSESKILDRFFGGRTPLDMSRHTALLRKVLHKEQKRRTKPYLVALAVLAVLALCATAIMYVQRKQIQRAQAAAADLFYAMKSLELEVVRLRVSTAEGQSYRDQREELRRQYLDYLEDLGIYGEGTPQDIQLIYRVVHRFGESEVNVPRAFVNEIRRYIDRWRQSNRLDEYVARANENGYGPIIAQTMLANDMPPEFFYLALQESGFKLEAVGRETRYGIAKGMWQFMPETARALGLQTGPLVGVAQFDPLDERHQLEKSTEAAARYLWDIYTTDAQASGLLVIASYNWGQGNVLRLIRTMPENPRERNFWQLLTQYRDRIPEETYHYVFSIVSAAVIGENPSLFGFEFDPPLPREPETSEGGEIGAL